MHTQRQWRYVFHGTSTKCQITFRLLPPVLSGCLAESDRKKNLDRVFFTADMGLARIYAGRACRKFGGSPVIYRVIPMGDVVTLRADAGATVYHSEWAFVEPI